MPLTDEIRVYIGLQGDTDLTTREYTLNCYIGTLILIQGIFLNEVVLSSLGISAPQPKKEPTTGRAITPQLRDIGLL